MTKQTDQKIKELLEYKKVRENFIQKILVKNVDYGSIHIARECQYIQTPEKCEDPTHWSKPRLNKPGSEKFLDFFELRAVFFMDAETWKMTGEKPGAMCYVCNLVDDRDDKMGEGRGACDLSEVGTINKAIKMAQIRAQIDAVLRHGSLSDAFTQDIEESTPQGPDEGFVVGPLASSLQRHRIGNLLMNKGKTEDELLIETGLSSFDELTSKQAATIIANLIKMPDVK